MSAPRFRLVATDLDGTLLDPMSQVTPRAAAAIRAVRAAGALVVPVTARGAWSAEAIAADAGMDAEAVLVSGAVIYDLSRRRVIDERALSPDEATRAVHALRDAMPGVVFACARDGVYDTEPGYVLGIEPPAGSVVADALELAQRPMWKLSARVPGADPASYLTAVRRAVPGAHVVLSGGDWVEVLAPEARKAAALQRVCAARGITADEVIAFGDLPIDREMLDWAGHGVAPGNAHPDVRAAADEVAGGNEADGVAIVLERLLAEGAFG